MELKEAYISVVNTADEVWSRTNGSAIEDGELIFAYKNTDADIFDKSVTDEVLYQVTVTRQYNNNTRRKYTVSVTTSSISYTLNMLPKEYLLNELTAELEKFKVSGKILANFKQIIEDIEE
jgi:hypothetical protein